MSERENTSTSFSVLDPEDDAPDLTTLDFSKGWFELGGERISDEEGRRAFGTALEGQPTITIDSDIAAYFRTNSAGEGIETAVNKFLRQRISLEAMFRRVLREELRKKSKEAS